VGDVDCSIVDGGVAAIGGGVISSCGIVAVGLWTATALFGHVWPGVLGERVEKVTIGNWPEAMFQGGGQCLRALVSKGWS